MDGGDRLSELPDHVLILIISLISTREALRATTLSRRWAHLFRFVSAINLCCLCHRKLHISAISHCDCRSNPRIDGVRRLLQRHYSHIRFFEFPVSFFDKEKDEEKEVEAAQFKQCISSLGELRVEKLILRAPYHFAFPLHLLSAMPSLNYFKLYVFSLLPDFRIGIPCNSQLKTLKLHGVNGPPGSLDCILANCPSLCSLSMLYCRFPSKLCFRGHNLRLEVLGINDCGDTKEVEFFAPNLVTFEFDGVGIVDFIFDCVPKLHNVFLSFSSEQTMPYVCRKLVKDVPHVKTLLLDRIRNFCEEGPSVLLGINKFNNLKRLEFTVNHVCWFNLFSVIELVHACPLLQELYLVATGRQYGWPKVERDVIIHPNLKNVEFSGFGGTINEINFASYILRSAVGLQLMNISWYHSIYFGFGEWGEMDDPPVSGKEFSQVYQSIQQLIHQAKSTTVQVVFQKSSKDVSKQF